MQEKKKYANYDEMSVITSVEINARMNNAITKNKGKGAKVKL